MTTEFSSIWLVHNFTEMTQRFIMETVLGGRATRRIQGRKSLILWHASVQVRKFRQTLMQADRPHRRAQPATNKLHFFLSHRHRHNSKIHTFTVTAIARGRGRKTCKNLYSIANTEIARSAWINNPFITLDILNFLLSGQQVGGARVTQKQSPEMPAERLHICLGKRLLKSTRGVAGTPAPLTFDVRPFSAVLCISHD